MPLVNYNEDPPTKCLLRVIVSLLETDLCLGRVSKCRIWVHGFTTNHCDRDLKMLSNLLNKKGLSEYKPMSLWCDNVESGAP